VFGQPFMESVLQVVKQCLTIVMIVSYNLWRWCLTICGDGVLQLSVMLYSKHDKENSGTRSGDRDEVVADIKRRIDWLIDDPDMKNIF